jgi:hypothetical protein
MTAKACPFCGLATDVPHETQQGCIDALHAEIARVREILDVARPVDASIPTEAGSERTRFRTIGRSGRFDEKRRARRAAPRH